VRLAVKGLNFQTETLPPIDIASSNCRTKIGTVVCQNWGIAMRKWLSVIIVLLPPALFGALLSQSADAAAQSPPAAPASLAPTVFNP
jgi:hypothetical protein